MISCCEKFLPVFSQMSKFIFTEPIPVLLVTQGSSIRIDIFVFGSTLNWNKLDEKVKILRK